VSQYLTCAPGGPALADERATLERKLETREFFWLDLHRPSDQDVRILGEVFGFHPLALEDAEQFKQRPKVEDYEGFVFLVVYGATLDEDRLVEVHCFYSERYLVTVHRDDCPPFAELRARYEGGREHPEGMVLLYQVIDALVDSFFPILSEFDDELDSLEEELAAGPGADVQQRIFALRRRLVGLRKAVVPERDLVGQLASGTVELPGMSVESVRYFRDVYDHLIRIGDLMESYRDLLNGASDVYLSTASNRLNDVIKQLTVIATIFLPLTFLTGFFGQNFAWMVRHVESAWAFFVFGLGGLALTVVALVLFFRRRGWL
jgi:magnesium transporter